MTRTQNHGLRRAAFAAALATTAAAAAPAAHATVLFNTLASSQDGSDPLFGVGPLADSFSVGSQGEQVRDVLLLLTNSATGYTGTLQALLLADASNTPGATVASLGTVSVASVAAGVTGVYLFVPSSLITLTPNTRYWVELTDTLPNGVEWSYSNDTTADGVAGQYSYSSGLGVVATSSGGAYQMEIEVAEPASAALLAGWLLALRRSRRKRAV